MGMNSRPSPMMRWLPNLPSSSAVAGQRTSPSMAEAGIQRTYLQLAAQVDWHLERALAELT